MSTVALHALWIASALTVLVPSAADPDLWGHVLFGGMLLDGVFPTTNGLAYTAADHGWTNHELLAEAAMAGAFRLFGSFGLVALKTVLGLATLSLVWRTARRRSGSAIASAIVTAVAALVMAPGFMIRPQLFTLVFLALVLELVAAADDRPEGVAWLVPAIVVVWVNTHGGVLAGVGLAGVAVATATLVRVVRRPSIAGVTALRELARAAAWGLIVLAALLVNPYGFHLPHFLATQVTPHVPIAEWAAVDWRDSSFLSFKITLVLLAVWIASRLMIALTAWRDRHADDAAGIGPRLSEIAVVAIAAGAALLHRRHIPLFAIAAAPLLAAALVDVATRVAARLEDPRLPRLVMPTVAAAAALQFTFALASAIHSRGRIAVDPREYPIQAIRFLAQNDITGNVALPFRWGEYGLWALPAGSRIAVDGRFTTAYPTDLLEDAWRFMSGGPGWDALLTEHPTDVVVTDRTHAPARMLRNHPEWEYVYSDPVSMVFLRKVPSQADALARFEARAFHYDATPVPTEFPAAPHAEGSATLAAAWTRS